MNNEEIAKCLIERMNKMDEWFYSLESVGLKAKDDIQPIFDLSDLILDILDVPGEPEGLSRDWYYEILFAGDHTTDEIVTMFTREYH